MAELRFNMPDDVYEIVIRMGRSEEEDEPWFNNEVYFKTMFARYIRDTYKRHMFREGGGGSEEAEQIVVE